VPVQKDVVWIGSSLGDLKTFPDDVQDVVGYAIYLAQIGGKHPDAKPLRGGGAFRGAGVLEVVADDDGDTYRAIYTVRFSDLVYILHCFQNKSTRGIQTQARDIELVKQRLKVAVDHYASRRAGNP
jgi:phage-related protein